MDRKPRAPTSKPVETQVLTYSHRKCCLCYYIEGESSHRKGQIAHLNHNPSDSTFENLVWLCFDHHDEFDSITSQSKGLTTEEVRTYRDRLYKELGSSPKPVPQSQRTSQSDYNTPRLVRDLPQELQTVLDNAKDELAWILTPWDLPTWSEQRSVLFPFKAWNRSDGICRVERYFLRDGRIAVICRQIPDNPGQSVTNSIEEIAFQVCAQFQIPAAQLVLIDYYPHRIPQRSNYALVHFQQRPPSGMFEGPSWKEMTGEDWRDLGLRLRGTVRK